jgi:hypothetical protein
LIFYVRESTNSREAVSGEAEQILDIQVDREFPPNLDSLRCLSIRSALLLCRFLLSGHPGKPRFES